MSSPAALRRFPPQTFPAVVRAFLLRTRRGLFRRYSLVDLAAQFIPGGELVRLYGVRGAGCRADIR